MISGNLERIPSYSYSIFHNHSAILSLISNIFSAQIDSTTKTEWKVYIWTYIKRAFFSLLIRRLYWILYCVYQTLEIFPNPHHIDRLYLY